MASSAEFDLSFDRPERLAARAPAEVTGRSRDDVRLLVSDGEGHRITDFSALAAHLDAGDLLVVNDSATLPASLSATGPTGSFRLNLATDYGGGFWLAEPRWSHARPGPVGLEPGDAVAVGEDLAHVVGRHPTVDRYVFVRFYGDATLAMTAHGEPVRYAYTDDAFPLSAYQTTFARVPGSAEMPSAGRPFTPETVAMLSDAGVGLTPITLHTGLSGVEATDVVDWRDAVTPEPVTVPRETAAAVEATRERGGRVVAVGTTVVRAVETAFRDGCVRTVDGFTRNVVDPVGGVDAVDGLLTGLHDSETTHLAMLYGIAGEERVREAYDIALAAELRWHEFGDVHLLFGDR